MKVGSEGSHNTSGNKYLTEKADGKQGKIRYNRITLCKGGNILSNITGSISQQQVLLISATVSH